MTVLGCINSGAAATFRCPPGLILDGTDSLTCITNAHYDSDWNLEVNDSEIICSGNTVTVFILYRHNYSVIEGDVYPWVGDHS